MLCAPVAGLVVGLAAAALGVAADAARRRSAARRRGRACAVPAALTRGLHLDGLADTADGLGSGKPAEDALRIMKQSDIGPFGVITLVFALLAQVAALAELYARLVGPRRARRRRLGDSPPGSRSPWPRAPASRRPGPRAWARRSPGRCRVRGALLAAAAVTGAPPGLRAPLARRTAPCAARRPPSSPPAPPPNSCCATASAASAESPATSSAALAETAATAALVVLTLG